MRIDRWSFDDTGYYAYLTVDCPQSDFEELRNLLKERNFSVLAAGKSFRPAADGKQYDYYLRLGTPVDGRHDKPTRASVVNALKFSQALSPQSPPAREILADSSDVLAELGEMRSQLESLTRAVREMAEKSQAAVGQCTKQSQDTLDGIAQIGSRLREERTQIINSIVAALDTRLGDDERIGQLQQSIEEFKSNEVEWSSFNDELKRSCAEKDERILSLTEQLESATRAVDVAQPRASRKSQRVVFEACLPTVNLIRGCEDILFFEFSDPAKAIRKISRLVLEPAAVKGEAVEGARGWFELRFNTGNGNNGRLYFRRDGDKVDVLVSTKQEQDADIKYLRNHT